ncbi:hypothetical protein ACIRPS_04580 [Streptomyces griseoviridis]
MSAEARAGAADNRSRVGQWLAGELPHGGRLPRKRELAVALRRLLLLLKSEESAETPPTQLEMAKRLGTNPPSLSRFAKTDPRVPGAGFIRNLHAAARADSGQDVDITLDALQTLRVRAEAERDGRCANCGELGKRIDSLNQRLSEPCPACATHQQERIAYEQGQKEDAARIAELRGEVTALKAAARERSTVEAGLQARLATLQATRAPLPVPRRRVDRQRSEKERAAARQLANQADELDRAGNEGFALTILRQGTTELLSPAETALVVVELRQRERDHLADDLIHIYARDQGDLDVMTVAMALYTEGAVDDAGAILQAALR